MICLFFLLRLFLGSPSRRLQGSPNHPESGQDPEEGVRDGEEGLLVPRKDCPSAGQAQLPPWPPGPLWSGHSVSGSHVLCDALAGSELYPPGRKMALVERSVPAEWHRLPPAMGTEDLASVLATGSSWEGHRCGEDPEGPAELPAAA